MGKRSRSQSSKTSEREKRSRAAPTSEAEHPGYEPHYTSTRSKKIKKTVTANKSDTTKDVAAQATVATTTTTTTKNADPVIKQEDDNDDIVWDDGPDTTQAAKTSADAPLETETKSGLALDDIEIDDTDDTLVGTKNAVDKVKVGSDSNGEQDTFDMKFTDATPKKVKVAAETLKPTPIKEESPDERDVTAEKKTPEQEVEEKRLEEQEEIERKLAQTEEAAKEKEIQVRASKNSQKLLVGNFETCALMNVEDMPLLKKGLLMSTIGDMELKEVNVAGVKLEISVKVLGFETKAPDVDDDTCQAVLPTTEAASKLTVDTAKANTSKGKNLGDQGALNAPATYPATPRTGKPCRFGEDCAKRETCPFDHSGLGAVKKMCTYVNTIMGCAQGDYCIFSHAQKGKMCRKSSYRSKCPNGLNCGFKHEDDKGPTDDEDLFTGINSTFSPAPPVRERSKSAAVEIAERAAQEAITPPADAPVGPRNFAQHAGQKRGPNDDATEQSRNAQRIRTNSHFPQDQQWQPQQQGGYIPSQGQYFNQGPPQQHWNYPSYGPPPAYGGYHHQQGRGRGYRGGFGTVRQNNNRGRGNGVNVRGAATTTTQNTNRGDESDGINVRGAAGGKKGGVTDSGSLRIRGAAVEK